MGSGIGTYDLRPHRAEPETSGRTGRNVETTPVPTAPTDRPVPERRRRAGYRRASTSTRAARLSATTSGGGVTGRSAGVVTPVSTSANR